MRVEGGKFSLESMVLLGDANWWLPRWLQWLPRIHVEGKHHDLAAEEALRHETPVGASR